jgi:hypothetical protein
LQHRLRARLSLRAALARASAIAHRTPEKYTPPMPPFGLPRDLAQWIALALAVAVVALGPRLVRPAAQRRVFLGLAALASAALSAGYIAAYLRGGPRIIDATSYYLEGRALAEGLFAWPLASPEAAVLGRFLVRSGGPSGVHAAVIFPPGYPLLLALGFLLHAPLAIGPLLAAGLAVATYDLADRVTRGDTLAPATSALLGVPELAAIFSVLCAALRYHTADTMSHGLAALCATSALALGFRAVDACRESALRRAAWLAVSAGLALGWLAATRPVSAFAVALTLALSLSSLGVIAPFTRLRLLGLVALGVLPGLLLLLAHQRAATGSLGLSSQRAYYAAADGPPGCFRYGFGAGIGCVGEHHDFVVAHLARGYGVLQALGTTLRRLKQHLVDPLNAEPLALLVLLGGGLALRAKGSRPRLLALAVLAQIVAYAPFYFDGNYPGGGARFFADILPLEHVLAAIAIASLASRSRSPARLAALGPALALVGFALRAGFDHAQLRDREGGRPMFEPRLLAEAGVARGLVFLDTDHGFNLAFDPAASARRAASTPGLEVARYHGDGVDRLLWAARGQPPAFRYRYEFQPDNAPARVSIEPLSLAPPGADPLPIEGESLWPPREQRDGWAFAEYASGTCASSGRWLALHSAPALALAPDPAYASKPASVRVGVPALPAGGSLEPRVALGPEARGELTLEADSTQLHRWRLDEPALAPGALRCFSLPAAAFPPGVRSLELVFSRDPWSSRAGAEPLMALDRVDLTGAKTIDPR